MKNKILGSILGILSISLVSANAFGMMDETGIYRMSFFSGLIYLLVVINLGFLAIYLSEKIWGKKKR